MYDHEEEVLDACMHPTDPNLMASLDAEGVALIRDLRMPQDSIAEIRYSTSDPIEIGCIAFNRYSLDEVFISINHSINMYKIDGQYIQSASASSEVILGINQDLDSVLMITDGDMLVCYDWNVDNIVHEYEAPTIPSQQQGGLTCLSIDMPVSDYGQQKFEANATATGARCAVMGTENGDLHILKSK